MIQILDSLWGTVTNCQKIAPYVYMVDTIRPDADPLPSDRWQQGGIVIDAEMAELLLPYRAIPFGEYGLQSVKDGSSVFERKFLQFGSDGPHLIPLYELLAVRYITDYGIIQQYDVFEVLNDGRLRLPEYFGELIFPFRLLLRCNDCRQIENGVWLFRTDKGNGLCVHKTVAEYFMSDAAVGVGTSFGNSYVFWESQGAVALYELAAVFRNTKKLVPDEKLKELLEVIKTQYRTYYTAIAQLQGGQGTI